MSPNEYRPIPDFEGYVINCYGSIFGRYRKFLKPTTHRRGHLYVCLRKDGRSMSVSVHTLVAKTFIGPRPADMECCHNDGVAANNFYKNLRWDTHRANSDDTIRHGSCAGENHGNSKITQAVAREIKDMAAKGMTTGEISKALIVSAKIVSHFKCGRRWRNA